MPLRNERLLDGPAGASSAPSRPTRGFRSARSDGRSDYPRPLAPNAFGAWRMRGPHRVPRGAEASATVPVTAIVRVSAPEEKCAPLGACVRELDGVLESHRVTGTDRLILKIVARSIAHLDDIIGALARYGTPIVSIVLASKSRPIRGPA